MSNRPVARRTRERILVAVVAALVMAFTAQLRRSEKLPSPDPMLTFVAAPPPPAPVPIRLPARMPLPKRIVDVAPAYPAAARAAGVEGVVVLEVVIDAKGGVQTARVLRSIPLLDQAAVDAVHQWRFAPTVLEGQAVSIVMTVTVNFALQRR